MKREKELLREACENEETTKNDGAGFTIGNLKKKERKKEL